MTDTPAPSPAPADPQANPSDTGQGRVIWAALASPFTVGFFLVLGGLVAWVLGTAVSNLSTIIIYIAFALFVALGLEPIVQFLERRKFSRPWAIVTVYAGFALLFAGVLWLIIPTVVSQVGQFFSTIPKMISDFQKSDAFAWAQSTFGDQIGTLLSQVQGFLTNPSNIAAIGGGVLAVGTTIATTISGIIIVLVLSLYFLAALPVIKKSFVRLTPARSRPTITFMTDEITDSIGGYLMGMVILAFCNSIVAFFLHLFLGLPFPALMGVMAFCITLIPLIGPVLYWVVATVLALFSGPVPALIFAIIYLVYIQIEAYVLTPRVMNRTISVPGSLVVIGALVGGTLLGLLGALVAIPITASLLLIIKQIIIPRQDAKV